MTSTGAKLALIVKVSGNHFGRAVLRVLPARFKYHMDMWRTQHIGHAAYYAVDST